MPTEEIHMPFPLTWNTGSVQNTVNVLPGKYSYKDWVSHPGWKRTKMSRAVQGILTMLLTESPYWHKQWNAVWGVSSVTYIPFGGVTPTTDYGNWGMMGPVNPSLPTAQHNEIYAIVLKKLGSRINGTQFNLPLFMAELGKTKKMILNAKDVILRMLRGLPPNRGQRRINGTVYWKKSGSKVDPKPVSPLDIWLEYRYGWRLLVRDIYDSLCAISDAQRMGLTASIKVRHYQGYEGTTLWRSDQTSKFNSSLIQADCLEKWSTYREVVLTLKYLDQNSRQIATLQQFGVTNPLNLVWELIPYSFVLDWFIPVGEYLSQLDMFIGKTFQGGTVSYIERRIRSFKPVNFRQLNTSYQPRIVRTIVQDSSLTERYYRRQVLTSFPVAKPPQVHVNLDLKRVIDAIGLINQRIR